MEAIGELCRRRPSAARQIMDGAVARSLSQSVGLPDSAASHSQRDADGRRYSYSSAGFTLSDDELAPFDT